MDLDGPQVGGPDTTYFDYVSFTGTKVWRAYQTVSFDRGNGTPDPGIGPHTFSASWAGQGEVSTNSVYTFTTTASDQVRLSRGRQETDRGRRLDPLSGFSGREVGAFHPASGEVPVIGVCGVFDTKHGALMWWRIDEDGFGVMERSKHEQYLRNPYANVGYLLVRPLRELSRRSKNICVGPCANPLRFSARFADFSVGPARNSDNSSFRRPVRKPLQFRNIAGWAVLPVALGRDA